MNKTTMVILGIAAVVLYFIWKKRKTTTATAPVATQVTSEEAQVAALLAGDAAIG